MPPLAGVATRGRWGDLSAIVSGMRDEGGSLRIPGKSLCLLSPRFFLSQPNKPSIRDLSRRDELMVACHEVPGTGASNRSVPLGYGLRSSPLSNQPQCVCAVDGDSSRTDRIHAVAYGTDSWFCFSRHFVPGHHRFVPPGQKATSSLSL